jgi:hypothetical protein
LVVLADRWFPSSKTRVVCDLPDELVVDDGVPVDEHVPEGDDPWQVRDLGCGSWVETAEPLSASLIMSNCRSTAERSIASPS